MFHILVEFAIGKKRLFPVCTNKDMFCDFFSKLCELLISNSCDNLFTGDMNYNILVENVLSGIHVCEIYGLRNLVKWPTRLKGRKQLSSAGAWRYTHG